MNADNRKSDLESPLTSSTALLSAVIGVNPGYRLLTPYEQELLRKSKQEIGEYVRLRLRGERKARNPNVLDRLSEGPNG